MKTINVKEKIKRKTGKGRVWEDNLLSLLTERYKRTTTTSTITTTTTSATTINKTVAIQL